ncbi:alpha/beta hydrolase [Rhodothermaceae bacterium RA]|nr:alpha/beta hydrolase [Rhodothermaceae bacterium RA]
MPSSPLPVQSAKGFRFIEAGPPSNRPPIVLLHGMLGGLSNWTRTITALNEANYRVLAPVLPVYHLPLKESHVLGLVTYTHRFLETMEVDQSVLVGNSLGGHVALLYALQYPRQVAAMVLSGASGIYEVEIGTSTMRRRDREFIRERAAMTFYDPIHVTDELVDDMLEIVNNRATALRLIRMARSTQQETVTDRLHALDIPTLLIWGRDDRITPPDVAEEFLHRLPQAQLRFIDRCGHAPMIEHPELFNQYTLDFLSETIGTPRPVTSTERL